MTTVSFHFHGYQPGDIVRWREPDPLKSQSWEERVSPVSHAVGADRFSGRNWTDAVLQTYGRLQAVLDRAAGAASVDIEPQTLVWLLQRDPDAFHRVRSSLEGGSAALALTPPFHPILPHLHRFEREVLFDLMIDFYAPLLRGRPEARPGLWLPEAAFSRETIEDYLRVARGAAVGGDGLPDLTHAVHLLLDGRQFSDPGKAASAWAVVDGAPGIAAVGRDHPLSSEFAFGPTGASDFCHAALSRGKGHVFVASDLESLLANPAQAERFETIVQALRAQGAEVRAPVPPSGLETVPVVEFSSWSDYDEYLQSGHTSDTRWTGLLRQGGLVVPRMHRGRRMSQLWKHAFTLASERIETVVRRAGHKALKEKGVVKPPETLRHLSVAYGRHLFRPYYLACGTSAADLDVEAAMSAILGGRVDLELAGYVARGYLFMLMGLRSDPRFWDNPDTRVTFQNVACLAHSLVDMAEASRRAGDEATSTRLLRLLRAALIEFSEGFARWSFGTLQGLEGWETTEEAWLESLQSEVPDRSPYDVVKRAALFAVGERLPPSIDIPRVRPEEVVADTGHIAGEVHGQWENPAWCEHRPS